MRKLWSLATDGSHGSVAVSLTASPEKGHIEHHNNFNLIRLMAAVQVMTIHIADSNMVKSPIIDALRVIPGVPTFYLISGYLIYASYVRTAPSGLGVFARNRALRIFPGLWACTILSVLSVVLTGYLFANPPPVGHFFFWLFSQMSILQFYNPDFLRGYGTGVLNGALWTISIELQFYILTPILAYLLRSRRNLFVALFVASLSVHMYLRFVFDGEVMWMKLLYVSSFPWVFIYMIGMLAAHFPDVATRFVRLPTVIVIGALLVSQVMIGNYHDNASNNIGPLSVLLIGILVLKFSTMRIPGLSAFQRFIQKSDFSYGMYLYHMPVINFLMVTSLFYVGVNMLLTPIIVLGLAIMSWYFVEKPSLLRKK